MRRSALVVLMSLCSLAACAQHEAGVSETPPPDTTASPPMATEPAPTPTPGGTVASHCNADAAQSSVGQPGNDANVAAAQAAAGARIVRVIKPGQMVTMDYSADRLNVDLDAQGKIAKLHCG